MSNVESVKSDSDEFLSMADIVRMLWRHIGKISIFSVLAACITAAFVLGKPAGFESSVLLQVIPEYAKDGRMDKEQFETAVLTHLEMAQSPLIASGVLRSLQQPEDLAELYSRVKITRPPKTSIIKIVARDKEQAQCLEICALWTRELFAVTDKKNIEKAQIFIRSRVRELQDEWIKQMAVAADVRARADQMQGERLLTVERSVDDQVLWRDLTSGVTQADVSKMTNLFLKSQEVNLEYLDIQRQLMLVEQQAASAKAMREVYQTSLDILQAMLRGEPYNPEENKSNAVQETVQYVDALAKTRDIVSMGDVIVYPAKRGVLKKTIIALFCAFAAASLFAFLCEWFKQARIRG